MQSEHRSAKEAEVNRVAVAFTEGGDLAARPIEGLPLARGEVAYADVFVHGWRYYGLGGLLYATGTMLVGGPLMMALTAMWSRCVNRRERCEAERIAEPQWRPLGRLRVVVTSERLLVWHRGAWASVVFDTIVHLQLHPGAEEVDLFFASDPPYKLAGPGVWALVVLDAYHRRMTTAE